MLTRSRIIATSAIAALLCCSAARADIIYEINADAFISPDGSFSITYDATTGHWSSNPYAQPYQWIPDSPTQPFSTTADGFEIWLGLPSECSGSEYTCMGSDWFTLDTVWTQTSATTWILDLPASYYNLDFNVTGAGPCSGDFPGAPPECSGSVTEIITAVPTPSSMWLMISSIFSVLAVIRLHHLKPRSADAPR